MYTEYYILHFQVWSVIVVDEVVQDMVYIDTPTPNKSLTR
jgi:hypothetical protein